MNLTSTQNAALKAIGHWLNHTTDQEFILAGYAGTGKTTLLQEFINGRDELTLCVAPTGKAASVLSKRLENAIVTTIHSALYKPVMASPVKLEDLMMELVNDPENKELKEAIEIERDKLTKAKLGFALNDKGKIRHGDLVIVDEASMVTNRIRTDLANTQARILYVGDPGQLPPVMDVGFFRDARPDVMLEEVLRQALDSGIIRMSMEIRQGRAIPLGRYSDDARKLEKTAVHFDEWLGFDQIITGKNTSRRKINRFFRTKRYPDAGRSIYPLRGDKLICLKNEFEDNTFYINGVIGSCLADVPKSDDLPWLVAPELLYEGEIIKDVCMWKRGFEQNYDETLKDDMHFERQGMRQFDYAYGITVHKSQGSEWDRVIIADDQMSTRDRDFRKCWLYTAVTRAKKELLWLV